MKRNGKVISTNQPDLEASSDLQQLSLCSWGSSPYLFAAYMDGSIKSMYKGDNWQQGLAIAGGYTQGGSSISSTPYYIEEFGGNCIDLFYKDKNGNLQINFYRNGQWQATDIPTEGNIIGGIHSVFYTASTTLCAHVFYYTLDSSNKVCLACTWEYSVPTDEYTQWDSMIITTLNEAPFAANIYRRPSAIIQNDQIYVCYSDHVKHGIDNLKLVQGMGSNWTGISVLGTDNKQFHTGGMIHEVVLADFGGYLHFAYSSSTGFMERMYGQVNGSNATIILTSFTIQSFATTPVFVDFSGQLHCTFNGNLQYPLSGIVYDSYYINSQVANWNSQAPLQALTEAPGTGTNSMTKAPQPVGTPCCAATSTGNQYHAVYLDKNGNIQHVWYDMNSHQWASEGVTMQMSEANPSETVAM